MYWNYWDFWYNHFHHTNLINSWASCQNYYFLPYTIQFCWIQCFVTPADVTCSAWSTAACQWAAGRWWWSSSPLRWSWGSAGSAAGAPRATLRSPARPPSELWRPSSLPQRQWSERHTHTPRPWVLSQPNRVARSSLAFVSCPRPDLRSGLSAGLGLGSHRSLQLLRQLHVLDLHPLHLNSPRISGFIQGFLSAGKH